MRKNNTARKVPALTPQLQRPSNVIAFPGTEPIVDTEYERQRRTLVKAARQFQALLDVFDQNDIPSFDFLKGDEVIWSVERRIPRG